jgi:cyclophilin family peptidyl-prolyl cis-trans isomerase
LYGLTSEDDGRGYAAATLPFQSYGALGMARSEFEPNSASSQFFMLLFESDLTPAGKNMLDGRYTCFGYTVKGADLLKGVKEGDIVSSMKVIKGMDKFIPAK